MFSGGAVASLGALSVNRSTFTAAASSKGNGGAAWSSTSSVTAAASVFERVTAKLRGGAVFAGGSGSALLNCTFTDTSTETGEVRVF